MAVWQRKFLLEMLLNYGADEEDASSKAIAASFLTLDKQVSRWISNPFFRKLTESKTQAYRFDRKKKDENLFVETCLSLLR